MVPRWTLLLHDIFVLVKNVRYVFSKDTKGRCPEFARSIFYGGTYCNLKLERQRVNPAVTGNKFQQLAVKAREKASSAEIAHSVQPAQLRFLIRGGVSSNTIMWTADILGGLRHMINIFKVDVANAFNSVRHNIFLTAAKLEAPDFYKLL